MILDKSTEDEAVMFLCQNKKNLQHLQDYLVKLEQGKKSEISKTIPILVRVFTFYTKQNTWRGVESIDREVAEENKIEDANEIKDESEISNSEKITTDSVTAKTEAEKKVDLWLYNAYKSCIKILLSHLEHTSVKLQVKSFKAVMSLIQAEYMTNIHSKSNAKSCKLNFPNSIYIKVIKQLLLIKAMSNELLECFASLLPQYDDLTFYCVKNIHSLLENQKIASKYPFSSVCIARNTQVILQKITESPETGLLIPDAGCTLYTDAAGMNLDTTQMKKTFRHFFSSAWMSLLHLPNLPSVVHKKILLILDTKVMPRLHDPKLLIDFLMDSYDAGGVSALLALNGLFVLINKYNLDYPEFYAKLYVLLDVNIFHTKYKARFFHHLDLFLTSTYLPGYLVCAFVKKLTRISLFTPGDDLVMLLKFIRNLMIRHQSSRILIHRQNASDVTTITTDPFDFEQADPFNSNASKSCLWELETLKSHYSRDVVKYLFAFRKEFPTIEENITVHFDKDFEHLINTRLAVEVSAETLPPFAIDKRKEIFSLDTDMWCF